MSYELLEQQIKALPVNYYQELVDFLEFLTEKVAREYKKEEDYSLQKMREGSLQTVWEQLKDDTW